MKKQRFPFELLILFCNIIEVDRFIRCRNNNGIYNECMSFKDEKAMKHWPVVNFSGFFSSKVEILIRFAIDVLIFFSIEL